MNTSTFLQGLAILALVWFLRDRIPLIGYLPGDFDIRIGNARIFFPLASGLVISFALSILKSILR